MKRCMAVFLALSLFLRCAALGEEVFAYQNATDAKMKALRCLKDTAFTAEFGNTERNELLRWEEPLRLYVEGTPCPEDLETLNALITELNLRVPMLPNIFYASSSAAANVRIWFGPLNEMQYHISNYTEGNWGYFTYWHDNDGCINELEVAIANDVTNQYQRNHIIMEELVGGLGLTNDHTLYSDSIVYQPWTETQQLSQVDWLMLNMIYHPALRPGMSTVQAISILESLIMRR